MLTATLTAAGFDVTVLQGAPHGELLDEVLVTTFDGGELLRLAVFDPAENGSRPRHREHAHRSVGVARRWMRAERDPLIALAAAADELYDPRYAPDANATTTLAFCDLVRDADSFVVLAAGRMADAEVCCTTTGGTRRIFTDDMFAPGVLARLGDVMLPHRMTNSTIERSTRRWHERGHVLTLDDWVWPPLGATPVPRPQLADDATRADLGRANTVLVATDGLELDATLGTDTVPLDLAAHVQALTTRPVPAGVPYRHGDLAAVTVTPSR